MIYCVIRAVFKIQTVRFSESDKKLLKNKLQRSIIFSVTDFKEVTNFEY